MTIVVESIAPLRGELLERARARLTLAGVVKAEALQRRPRDVAMSRLLE
jgi:hypothetical protein